MSEHTAAGQAEQALADHIDDLVPTHGYRKIPVIGLGGSASSIEALQAFFTVMPARTPLAFVLVIHLSPEHDSMLADLLQRCTPMPVVQVQQALELKEGTVYVIPPGRMLHAVDGQLQLDRPPAAQPWNVTVDIFFRTLADSHGPHAAAVVLSGMDGDGAIGIKRIKERGGLTLAQDPGQCAQDSMPRTAIATGMVDWILPVQDMPARLLSYFRLERALCLPPEDVEGTAAARDYTTDEARFREVLAFVRSRTNRDFTQYKRATVLRRIARRMQVNGVDNLGGYINCLHTRKGECEALLQDLVISVTNFFRDSDCFAALASHIPTLFTGKGPKDVVRIWVMACATGEEAFSIAMLLSEHARMLAAPPLFQVFATDIDEASIKVAREAIYPSAIEADVNEERLRRFFQKEPRGYRVRRELRETVLFAIHDVLSNSPFSRLDLASCRNLLIYLNRPAQKRVIDTVHFALVPGGKLFLGSSESIDEGSARFDVLDKKNRIYRQRPALRSGLLPAGSGTLTQSLEALPVPCAAPVPIGSAFLQPPRAAAVPTGAALARGALGEMHLRLLERLGPPSLVVDADYEMVHLSFGVGRFLQVAGGEPTRNLLRCVQPELLPELRAALHQSAQSEEPTQLRPMALDIGGVATPTAVRVVPFGEAGRSFFLVSFEVHPAEGAAAAQTVPLTADPLARHLDREIERMKSQLRETVEQYEASTEELKASNEELQAMNEAMRAAAEELETGREELQSINEELSTVNQELKSKVDQLSHANSDLQNLMDATAIAAVFLDRDLCITRYTPAAVSLFNLIPSDLGRPLTDLATQLDYPELGADAAQVLERLVPLEREVGRASGTWYLARLMPYRTIEDRIAGVVFALIDTTERKQAEEARWWLSAVVTATADGIISFGLDRNIRYAIFSMDLERRVTMWNTGAERILGLPAAEAVGQRGDMIFTPEERAAGAPGQETAAALKDGRAADEREHMRKDGSRFRARGVLMLMRNEAGEAVGYVKVLRDLSRTQPQPPA